MSDLVCKNCMHSRCSKIATFCSYLLSWKAPESYFYKCSRTLTSEHYISHPVTGKTKVPKNMKYCDTEREYGDCGPDAKYWTPKKKKDLFKMLTKEYNG